MSGISKRAAATATAFGPFAPPLADRATPDLAAVMSEDVASVYVREFAVTRVHCWFEPQTNSE